MLRGIVGCSPWLGDWKQCTRCGYQTKENVFSCPKCKEASIEAYNRWIKEAENE